MGDLMNSQSARSLAMGLSFSGEKGAASLYYNPALMGIDNRMRLDFSLSSGFNYEKITRQQGGFPFVEDNSLFYLSNSLPPYIDSFSFVTNIYRNRFFFGFSLSTLSDFNYSFRETERQYEKKSMEIELFSAGQIYSLNAGISIGITKKLAAGLNYGSISGIPEAEYRKTDYDGNENKSAEQILRIKRNFSGGKLTAGLKYDYSEYAVFTFSYGLENDLDYSESVTSETLNNPVYIKPPVNETLKYPGFLSLSVFYKFPGTGSPSFILEVLNRNAGSVSMTRTDPNGTEKASFIDTTEYHLGVEYIIKRKVPVRYGLALIPQYHRLGAFTTALTAGTGYRMKNFFIDISFAYYLSQETSVPRTFRVPYNQSYPLINEVTRDNHYKKFMLTMGREW